ncbi:MAG: nickel-type superoxide dismutase maturation protease [Leptolyngbyaceae cyanobacterium]
MTDVHLQHATTRDLLCWVFRRYRRFRVTGDSMLPTLPPNSEVLINLQSYLKHLPHAEDIVVAYHPLQPQLRIVKRVKSVDSDGACFLSGDNERDSQDSRHFGLVPLVAIIGKVHCLLP